MERTAEPVAIAWRDCAALIAQPAMALDATTRQQLIFTRRDLARFMDQHTADQGISR